MYRQLTEMEVACMVTAPGLIPHRPSDRVKTDRRDARTLVRALRNGDLTGVFVPTKKDESVRGYLRMYEDMKVDLKKVKQRLLHFLLRRGLIFQEGGNWMARHKRWMRSLEMEHPIDQETFLEYLCRIDELEERIHTNCQPYRRTLRRGKVPRASRHTEGLQGSPELNRLVTAG